MRARATRVLVLSAVVAFSLSLSAAPNRADGSFVQKRDESAIVKIIKKVKRGIAALDDSLTIPIPAPKP